MRTYENTKVVTFQFPGRNTAYPEIKIIAKLAMNA
jgi:hypothetical protein